MRQEKTGHRGGVAVPPEVFLPFVRDRLGLSIGDLYDLSFADLQRELGYMDGKDLAAWCRDYMLDGTGAMQGGQVTAPEGGAHG